MNLEFTIPPTLNKLFKWKQRRSKSDDYKNWLELAQVELLKQETYKITGDEWLEVNLTYFMPLYNLNGSKKKKDLDNYMKALFDFLWDNIEWFKDEHIKVIKAEKKDSELNKVKIYVREI